MASEETAARGSRSLAAPTTLGRTGLRVSRLGIGSSYGVPARAVERAYREHGINYLYWGSLRRGGMAEAIRNLSRTDRDRLVIALQSYDRTGWVLEWTLERGLRTLGLDRADLLILGWHASLPGGRLLERALALRERGRFRFLALSGHRRSMFGELARRDDHPVDVFMFRYNAAHRGAETEIFPFLPARGRPGTVAFTATRWGTLLDPRRMPPGEPPLRASTCYRFALTAAEVDLCLAGPSSEAELDEALRALEAGPLSQEELERVRRIGDFVRGRRLPPGRA